MSDFANTIWCAGCGAEILYSPHVVNKNDFCCQDCALGFSCKCGRASEREEDYREKSTIIEAIHQEN